MPAHSCSCLNATTSRVSWIDDACADAVALAQLLPERRAWVAVCVPVALPESPIPTFTDAVGLGRTLLWQGDTWQLALGAAADLRADGPGRTGWLTRSAARLEGQLIARSPVPGAPALPAWIAAWAFEELPQRPGHWGTQLPAARLILPRRLLWRTPERGWELLATEVAADEDPGTVAERLVGPLPTIAPLPPAPWPRIATDYAEQVDDAISLIADGVLRKVVLARAVDEVVGVGIPTILERLSAIAGSTLYAHDLDDGSLFLGATPEELFAAQGTALTTMALAGTTRRGESPAEDLALVAELMASTKQRKEHNLVVEHLAVQLRHRCQPFPVPNTPHHRLAARLIHLETVLTADLLRSDYLDVLGAVHPTPAVCGLPTHTAAHYINRHEHLQRGLYAGVLGWLTPAACRFIVPLRGGILHADGIRARLFAGAGIVETSVPAEELAETDLKFGPMRQAIS
jgi:salicylate biosynthesis isochorismate synthase